MVPRKTISVLLVVMLSLSLATVAAPSTAVAGSDSWSNSGLNGKNVLSLAFGGKGTVFAGTMGTGLYKSVDGGSSWSTDTVGGITGSVYAVACSPGYNSDNTVAIGTGGGGTSARLSISSDGGDSWNIEKSFASTFVHAIAFSPNYSTDKTIVVGTHNGFNKSTNGGSSWTGSAGLSGQAVQDIVFSPDYANDGTIFAAVGNDDLTGGVYISTDKGMNWTRYGPQTPMLKYTWVTVNYDNGTPSDPSDDYIDEVWKQVTVDVYLAVNSIAATKQGANFTIIAGLSNGVYKSVDSGATWKRKGGFASQTGVYKLETASSVTSGNTVAAGTDTGVYLSNNAGDTWSILDYNLVNDWVYAIAFAPDYSTSGLLLGGVLGAYTNTAGVISYEVSTPGSGGNTDPEPDPGNGSGPGGGGGPSEQPAGLAAPTGLTSTPYNNSISLIWNDVSGAAKYYVYRKAGAGSYERIGTPQNSSFIDATALQNTTYTYYVTAVDSKGVESERSNETTTTLNLAGAIPTGVKATSNASSITISWNPVIGVKGYNIYRKAANAAQFSKLTAIPLTTAVFVDSAVAKGILYTYYVTSISSTGVESGPSALAKAGLSATLAQQVFLDVPANAWFKSYIDRLVAAKITGGYPNGTFLPNKTITRAEFAKMICLAMGWKLTRPAKSSFFDIKPTNWAYTYVETAKARGAIGGYPNGTFLPNKSITRAEMATIIAKTLALTGGSGNFKDIGGHWAHAQILSCVQVNIIGGYPTGEFRPNNSASRAEASKMVCGVLDNK